MTEKGRIITNGVKMLPHEMSTVWFLADLGMDIELIPAINEQWMTTPDIVMNSLEWEIKSLIGLGNQVVSNAIQRAVKQSSNIILDLRRVKRNQNRSISEAKREFEKSRVVKRMIIITKEGNVIDLVKKK